MASQLARLACQSDYHVKIDFWVQKSCHGSRLYRAAWQKAQTPAIFQAQRPVSSWASESLAQIAGTGTDRGCGPDEARKMAGELTADLGGVMKDAQMTVVLGSNPFRNGWMSRWCNRQLGSITCW